MEKLLDISPFVRIGLFILAGWIQGEGVNNPLVTYISTDPDLLAATVFGLTSAWYAAAKYFDWTR